VHVNKFIQLKIT